MAISRRRAGRPKGSGGKAEELSAEQVRRIDKCITGTRHELRNRALLYFGLGTGMRIDEIVGLRFGDIAPNGRVLSRVVLEKHSTKSKRSRTVSVSKQALQHLREYLQERKPKPGAEDPLFAGAKNSHRPMNTTYAVQLLGRMLRDAGVANASSHSLRRTHANALRRGGADLMVIKEQLGHSSLATTQRYFGVDPIEAQRAVDRLRF
jgi:integrase/recombinase XerD